MNKNVLIVGANKGIGLELARQYIASGATVYAACRQVSTELSALKCNTLEAVDVTDEHSIVKMVQGIAVESLDIVIHNAGILRSDQFDSINFDAMREHFEVNTLGPLRTIKLLERKLRTGSKVGIVSSRVGSIDDNTSSNNYAYRVSKTAVNMVGKCLSIDFAPKGVAVALLHPGYVKTQMTQYRGLMTPQESAAGLIKRMEELNMASSGGFVHASGEQLTW